MSLLDYEHSRERVQTRRRELANRPTQYHRFPSWVAVLVIVLAAVFIVALGTDAAKASPAVDTGKAAVELVADPGDQAWFLCVAHRPYGVGQVYNEFMVSSTVAVCFVDYSYNAGLPSCPNLYGYEVWYTPQYGGWTGPHRIRGPYC